jgi:uncharacterized membrane protein SirB2
MDKIINKIGIGLALLFMVMELTYINAKSLFYLVNEFADIDRFFAIVGSLAFSMVTVIVMRKSTEKWPKIVFPVFDTLLVFCGLNLKYYEAIVNGTDNEVRFWLTVFMALFTGLITYSLGIINYKENTAISEHDAAKVLQLEKKLMQKEDELQQKEYSLQFYENELEQHYKEMQQKENALQQLQIKLLQFEKLQEQITAARTCEYCGKEYPSEAAKRSHVGKCDKKLKTA